MSKLTNELAAFFTRPNRDEMMFNLRIATAVVLVLCLILVAAAYEAGVQVGGMRPVPAKKLWPPRRASH